METESISLKHEYSDHELADLSREIARALSAQSTLEREFESVRSDFKARISAQQALISSLSTRISSAFEMRSVRCLLADERQDGYRLVISLENGHVVKRRKLAPHERQLELPVEEGPPPEFFVTVELPNDDTSWAVDTAVVPLYEEEYEQIRELPDVRKVIVVDSVEDPAAGPDYVKPQDETEPVKRPLPKGKKRT